MEEKQDHAGDEVYSEEFFRTQQAGVGFAAIILPIVEKFVHPRSVIDVGCGCGAWLAVWKSLTNAEIYGVDGDYVDRSQLLIDEKDFHPANLERVGVAENLYKEFDLVQSLEVAEHLSPERADSFVEDLTRLGDVVLFSAAIIGQGGTNHVNEKMQSYWAEKFVRRGYVGIDCIRPKIWDNPQIDPWYKSNIFIYANIRQLYQYPDLQKYHLEHGENIIYDIIHPDMWFKKLIQFANTVQTLNAYLEDSDTK